MRLKALLPIFMALFLMLGANPQAIAGPSAAAPANPDAQEEKIPDPDRYIVSFTRPAQGKAALKAAGARIELDLPLHNAAAAHIPAPALEGLRQNYAAVRDAPDLPGPYRGPVLFIKGGESDYIQESHRTHIMALFPQAQLKVMPGCGHWLHAQHPRLFNGLAGRFLDAQSP